MKRILMISHSSNAAGGGEDDFMNLLNYMHTKYYIVSVVPEGVRVKQYSEYSHELKVIPDGIFPFTGFSMKSYIKYVLIILKKIIVLLPFLLKVKDRIDVCYVNSSTCFVETILVNMLGIPYVMSIKEIIQPDVARELLYKYYGYTSREVIVISKILKSLFEKACDYKSPYIVYSSINEKLYLSYRNKFENENVQRSNAFKILNIGVISPVKNQVLLIQSMGLVRRDMNYEVRFAGNIVDEKYSNIILNAVKEQNLENVNFCFMGGISKEQVIFEILSSDCVVITSKYEGMSLVFVESLFLERIVLATEVGVIPEIIKNGENGFIIDKENPEILAGYINLLSSDNELRKRISEKLYNYYRDNFSLEDFLVRHEGAIVHAC